MCFILFVQQKNRPLGFCIFDLIPIVHTSKFLLVTKTMSLCGKTEMNQERSEYNNFNNEIIFHTVAMLITTGPRGVSGHLEKRIIKAEFHSDHRVELGIGFGPFGWK